MTAEQIDDARGAAEMSALAGRLMPIQERLEQMHVRVGAALALADRGFAEAGQAFVLEMRVDERKDLLAKPQRIGIAAHMGMRQRQEHAGMIVSILGAVGDRAVDVEGAYPAAIVGTSVPGHEFEAVADQPIGRAVPAARLGDGEGVDLPGLRAHAFGFISGAASKPSASWKPPWRSSTPTVDHNGTVSSNSQWL